MKSIKIIYDEKTHFRSVIILNDGKQSALRSEKFQKHS